MKQYQFNAGARHCARERGAWESTFTAWPQPQELRGRLKRFVAECCVFDPQAMVSAVELHQAFERWSLAAGKPRVMLLHNFEDRLSAAGLRRDTGSAHSKARWIGISLKRPN